MNPALAARAISDDQWERLDAVADVLDRTPIASFDGDGDGDGDAGGVLARCEVLLGHWGCPALDASALERAPALRMLAYAAGTVKDVVTVAVWERGIVVTSAAAANAVPVAEFTLAAILFANKGVFLAHEWFRSPHTVRARRPKPVGNVGKVVGVVGASHVGRRVIELLRPFELDVLLYDPFVDAASLGVRQASSVDELCAVADVVTVHAPDVPATHGMIGAAQLAAMKDGAVLVNTARGKLVDTAALEAELVTGRISAVLDVTDPEPLPRSSALYALPNVFLTPHVAGSQGSELRRLADLAITEIERYASGEPPLYPVYERDLDRIA